MPPHPVPRDAARSAASPPTPSPARSAPSAAPSSISAAGSTATTVFPPTKRRPTRRRKKKNRLGRIHWLLARVFHREIRRHAIELHERHMRFLQTDARTTARPLLAPRAKHGTDRAAKRRAACGGGRAHRCSV